MKNNKNFLFILIYLIGAAVLVEIDQITKAIAENKLYMKEDFPIIKDVLELSYLRNDGAAWGMMSGRISFFLILTVIMVLVMTYAVVRMPVTRKYCPLFIVCLMLTSGAIGNFIDRVRFSYVRDFIYFKLINFPVFNVADILVTCSVIVLIILILFVYKDEDFAFLKFKADKESGKGEN